MDKYNIHSDPSDSGFCQVVKRAFANRIPVVVAKGMSPWDAELLVRAMKARDEECSRHHEPAPDPQETADGGEGIDIPETVKSSGIQEPREYRTPKRPYTPSPMPDAPISDTPIDSPKTAMPEPVPPRTLEGDSDPSHNGTVERVAELEAALSKIHGVDDLQRRKGLRERLDECIAISGRALAK